MKSRFLPRSDHWFAPAALTLLAATYPAAAQVKLPPLQFEEADEAGFFVRFGPRIQFNLEASVSMLPSTPAQPGRYDNGFVLPDVSGSASGLTWNWAYADAGQVAGDAINFERYSNLPHAGVFTSESDDPLLGGEVLFGVELGRFDLGRKEVSWGAEIGYAFTPFKVTQASTATGTVDYFAASHGLGGIVPPTPPYQGTFDGPGPLIDLNPNTSSTISSAATSTFDGSIESDLHLVKLGAWLEVPVTEKISASLSLGYSAVLADTTFTFREAITIANAGIPALGVTDISTGASEWQSGFYGQLRATWQFSHRIGAYVAGDYLYHSGFNFRDAGREVRLDFHSNFSASVGLVYGW